MTRGWLVSACAAAALLAVPASAGASLRFRDCSGVGCARVSVPLDRSGAEPGRVSLYVERREAARGPRRGVLLLLAGGPGQAATLAYGGPRSPDSYADIAAMDPRDDIVAFDQRGTGRSGLLRCPELERSTLIDAGAAAAACARRLGARRGLYRTSDSVEDIEALREALGVPRLNLLGVSYGTQVAQAYAAAYPTHTGRVLLDSVVDPAGEDPLYGDVFAAVPRVLRAVCGSGCGRFTRDPVTDTARLVGRLARGPLRGQVALPSGRLRPARMTRQELFFTLVAGDLDDVSRAEYPAAVVSALRGDSAPLLRLRRRAIASETVGSPREFSSALYAATVCEESRFPWPRSAPTRDRYAAISDAVTRIPLQRLVPFDASTVAGSDEIRMCRRWPEASPDPGPPALTFPDVPALMVDGVLDLRTPLEGARRAAERWPRAHVLPIPNTGHSTLTADLGSCAQTAARRFLAGRTVAARCRSSTAYFPAEPPLPASLGAAPRRGPAGARGHALGALELTLLDVAEDYLANAFGPPRGPGLRGGRWNWSGRPLELDRVELVPGVRVSGSIVRFGTLRQHGTLRLSGPAGPAGTVELDGKRVRGMLGGRPVDATILVGILGGAARAARSGSSTVLWSRLAAARAGEVAGPPR